MVYKNSLGTCGAYVAPACEAYYMKSVGVMCGSPSEYTTGGGGTYDNDTTNDNGDY